LKKKISTTRLESERERKTHSKDAGFDSEEQVDNNLRGVVVREDLKTLKWLVK